MATLVALAMTVAPAIGQDDSPIPQPGTDGSVSSDELDIALAAIEAREGLDAETRAQIQEQLRAAQAQIRNRSTSEQAAAEFAEALESAPPETARLNSELEEEPAPLPTAESLGLTDDTPLPDLEQSLARSRAELASVETILADLEARRSAEESRPEEARARIEELRTLRGQLESALDATPPPSENPLLTDARRLATSLRLSARSAELAMLEQETASHGVRTALLSAQLQVAARNAARQRRVVEIYQDAVNAARQDDVSRLLRDTALALRDAADKHPVIQELARENVNLGAALPDVVAAIQQVTDDLTETEAQNRQIENMLDLSRQRLEVGGVNRAIGKLFFEERRNLPQVSQYRQQVRQREQTLSNIGLAQVQIIERQRRLRSMDERIAALLEEVRASGAVESDLPAIRADIQQLLNARRAILAQMSVTYTTYLRAVGDLDNAQRDLLDTADSYKNFLDKYLLWIPNADVVGLETLGDIPPTITWMLSPSAWAETFRTLVSAFQRYTSLTLLITLVVIAGLVARPWLKRSSRKINQRVGHLATDSIRLTLGALIIAVALAVPIPLAIWIVGWELLGAAEDNAFPFAVASALLAIAPFTYNVRLLRALSVKGGVFEKHFGWSSAGLLVIRRQLWFLLAVAVPTGFVTVVAYNSALAPARDSVGRLGFVALMAIFALVFRAIINPRTGILRDYYTAHPERWTARLRWLWYALAIGMPLFLAMLSLAGFTYTSGTLLTGRLIQTIWLVLALVVLNQVIIRWLTLARRKISFQRALEERAAREAERKKEKADDGEAADEEAELLPTVERTPVDLDLVDQQTRRLLRSGLFLVAVVGCWGIWSEMLPVFSILDEIGLWTETILVEGVETQSPVTLADLFIALGAGIITLIASRNLPGLLEIAVLQRLELQPGSRYTIVTLVRYAVVTIGLIAVLNIIGWNWSRIQWLVAALSVGLGFGLQEIVANFVSGLIILFERPVRVGDTVTVGDLTGSVSKVRIRATTITDWDRKEIIVPNKAFITDQVVNWTLSDPITRLTIEVGVSYSTDVHLAQEVIEDALLRQPLILEEPKPAVYFMGFGDSSLNFRIYVYARQLADRFPIYHAVHQDVLQALRDNGIEIPFPQRDLHVRSVTPDMSSGKSESDPRPGD